MSDASSETPVPATNPGPAAAGQDRLRRGLQPRAVARAGLARGRRADARGRGQPGQRRDLRVGAARAAPGEYDFGWLDRILDLLHEAGIAVDLATPTAAPPAWFFRRTRGPPHRGRPAPRRRRPASFCPSSPAYRQAAAAITEQLARRYADHPALALWHVHNEYGGANAHCYCPTSAAAFRGWLRDRYGDLDALNEAWGTTFWSQRYGDWAEIEPPLAHRPASTPPSSSTSCASPPTRTWPASAPSATSCTACRPACR